MIALSLAILRRIRTNRPHAIGRSRCVSLEDQPPSQRVHPRQAPGRQVPSPRISPSVLRTQGPEGCSGVNLKAALGRWVAGQNCQVFSGCDVLGNVQRDDDMIPETVVTRTTCREGASRLKPPRGRLAAAALLAGAAGPLALCLWNAPRSLAQSSAGAPPAFEVASVKRSQPDGSGMSMTSDLGRLTLRN